MSKTHAAPSTKPYAGRTALVTGASSGIGLAFARVLAEQGANLIITARRAERLQTLAGELQAAHGCAVLVLPRDLADPDTPQSIADAAADAGHPIDIVVNNAGYGIRDRFADACWEDHAAFLQVMVTSVQHMTRLVLPGMVERNYGRIINVASVAGLLPGTRGHTLYGASKAFLIKASESLYLELEGTGVNALAVCPGFTYSEFHRADWAEQAARRHPKFLWLTAEKVARDSIAAVEAGRSPMLVNGWFYKTLTGAIRIVPSPWLRALSRRF